MSLDVDLAVIGGGIVGASVGFVATACGTTTCVIERTRIGFGGATRASGGIVRVYHDDPRVAERAGRSFSSLQSISRTLGETVQFMKTGFLCLEPPYRI